MKTDSTEGNRSASGEATPVPEYEYPELTDHGTLKELTGSGANVLSDSFTSSGS